MSLRKPALLLTLLSLAGLAGGLWRSSVLAAHAGINPDAPKDATALKEPAYVPRPKGALTFSRDIAPLINANCASCHRPGEVAPFSLLTYDDVKKRAKQIATVTQSHFMPPWKASEPAPSAFYDARHLTPEQIGLLAQWADEGAKPGNLKQAPAPPKFTEGWTLGQPDVVLGSDEPYMLAAEGSDVYRCFVLPANYSEDRYVSAVEVRPGNSKVVHHVIAFLDTSGKARELDAADPGPGYTSHGGIGITPSGSLGGWAPGNMPRRLPDGVGILLPKGADVVLQVHYHKDGKPEQDKTKIGLHFCKTPVDKRLRVSMVINPLLYIPPGKADYTIPAIRPLKINQDITVLDVMPHMHLIGRAMEVTATRPDGTKQTLVNVPDWDFNWQTTYQFKQPIQLPKGSDINLLARYDNSTGNPRNPSSPPKLVHWGEQTTDEMCLAFVSYTIDAEHLTQGKTVENLPEFGNRRRAGTGNGQGTGNGAGLRRLRELLGGK